MSLLQALVYFFQEACLSLMRSWKVSLLAILTITVSLFLGGVFLLLTGNLGEVISEWSAESKVVAYLAPETDDAGLERLEERLREAPWTLDVEKVSAAEARTRFRRAFPSLEDLLEGWGDDALPASLEVGLDPNKIEEGAFKAWLDQVRAEPSVTMIDDDRDWLAQLAAVVLVARGLGMVLGAILLATAVFTISSVIRLTAYLYRDEIAVMRLVGATEFFIRGPFYMEGLLQGTAGGLLAVAALFGGFRFVLARSGSSVLASLLTSEFLEPAELLTIVGVGGLAGLMGAVASLRKESLGQTSEPSDWTSEPE